MVSLDQPVYLDHLVSRVKPEHKVQKDLRDHKVNADIQDHMETKEIGELMENEESEVTKVQLNFIKYGDIIFKIICNQSFLVY